MNGIQSRKAQNINVDKHVGCLGRMVNLFDLSTGISGNRLLTDKPHRDGAMLSRSRSDVARIMTSPNADQIEDKPVVSELRRTSSNKNANGTPMKALIAQEMSKEVESKHNRPNVVAKLMGLDALPLQQSSSAAQRSHSKGYSRHSLSHSSIPVDCWEQDHVFLDNQMQSEVNKCQEQNECKDVYEIWQQSQRTSYSRDSSMQKGRCNENISETKMALVRQKFMEAKRLATDEKLRQSKEFQDALEVLSTNRDLFLRFLQEPNSLFSQQLYDLQTIPQPPETKRITVLKPSKVVDDKFEGSGEKSDKQAKNPTQMVQATGWEKNSSVYTPLCSNEKVNENPAQSTRIVVLKPSPGKTQNIKAVVSPPSSPSRLSHGEDFFEEPEEDEMPESREVAKEITRQMHENLMGHRRDETLLSSVFSNGYVGDESSFNKSEIEYAAENLSDLEAMSPTSRHSWDYINRFGSPYSSSSFSRASCSPESSVCREAKKRLSERWAMMALNGNSQEQRHVRRSSSTLGEMLALSDTKKLMKSEDEGINKEQEPRGSTSCFTSNLNKEEGWGDSPKSLVRSKSVPVSSTASGARLNVDVSDPETGKAQVPKELTSTKSSKSSLKGKVSSLFFSRTKKSSKEKCIASQSVDGCQPVTADTPGSVGHLHGMVSVNTPQCVSSGGHGECMSPGRRPSSLTSSPDLTGRGQKQGMISREAGLSVAKPVNVSENQDQPSPISVLEPPFEEDDNTFPESSGNFKLECPGTEVTFKSNLIDKSPPIESIARTLSWDDSCAETATPYPLKSSSVSPGAEEGQDWLSLVQTLIQSAGLDGRVQSDTFFTRWHSPESPLDPSLRDKYTGNEKEPLHEAKRRQRRSNRKLVFDCVNAALVEITGYGSESDRSVRAVSCSGAHDMHLEGELPMLVDHVWARMKEWLSGEAGCFWVDGGDSNSLVVERVVRNEVLGKGWSCQMRMELDILGEEIEANLLKELVDEAVVELTGRAL